LTGYNKDLEQTTYFLKRGSIILTQFRLKERGDLVKAFGKRFNGSMGPKERDTACLAWSQWEASIAHLIPNSHKEIMKRFKKNKELYS